MKFLFYLIICFLTQVTLVIAAEPKIACQWLPGCASADSLSSGNRVMWILSRVISEGIKYVAVVAVIALMLAWIKYMLSMGDEEKTNKAKMWIIYALAWVFLSIAAWSIINVINEFSI